MAKNTGEKMNVWNDELDEKAFQINRWIQRLDDVAIAHEAKWGIGRLEQIITPDILVKWNSQNEKLRMAVEAQDLNRVAELVQGSIRAWSAMEKNALDSGHEPSAPDYWEVKLKDSEFIYRIYKTRTECFAPAEDGVVKYSLTEVARMLESYQLVNKIKETFPECEAEEITKPFVEEDEIPF